MEDTTFTFTIDAFPAYTKFNKTKKVMAALQIIDPEAAKHNYADHSVLGHNSYRDNLDSKEYYENIYDKSVFLDPETTDGGEGGETTNP